MTSPIQPGAEDLVKMALLIESDPILACVLLWKAIGIMASNYPEVKEPMQREMLAAIQRIKQ